MLRFLLKALAIVVVGSIGTDLETIFEMNDVL
jgi:hypothetical protein